MFKIKSITLRIHDTSYGGYPYVATVTTEVDAKEWTKLKKAKNLGQLYGIDIGNEVYRLSNRLIPSYNPMVSDRRNAKNGLKTITLEYHFRDHGKAEKLGMELHKFKNGECVPKWGQYVEVYRAETPAIKATVTEFEGAKALSRIYG